MHVLHDYNMILEIIDDGLHYECLIDPKVGLRTSIWLA